MGRNLSEGNKPEGDKATARTITTIPGLLAPPSFSSSSSSSSSSPQQRNSRISEGNVNDQDQDFQRQLALVQEEKAEDHKRRSQRACQHRLLLQLLVLLCFVLGVLSQHYFPMDVSTDIFHRAPFRWVFLESMLESGVF